MQQLQASTSLYKPLQASKTPSGYPCIDKAAVKASGAVLERSGSVLEALLGSVECRFLKVWKI